MKKRLHLFLLFITLFIAETVSISAQDTVRMGDPRFLFSQVTDSTYFQIEGTYTTHPFDIDLCTNKDTLTQTLYNNYHAMEYKVGDKGVVLYGIAYSMTNNGYYGYQSTWNDDIDTVWLKVRRGSETGYIEGGRALDSVRISFSSEEKTFLFQLHPFSNYYYDSIIQQWTDSLMLDSIVYDAQPLYCGYFERPLQISDTNFFVSVELVAPYGYNRKSQRGLYQIVAMLPPIMEYYYQHYANHSPCGVVGWCPRSTQLWGPLLPILVPRDEPDPDPDADAGLYSATLLGARIYPNPARSFFTVECEKVVRKAELYDMMGRMVCEWNGSNCSYDITGIMPGIYSLRLVTTTGTVAKHLAVVQ